MYCRRYIGGSMYCKRYIPRSYLFSPLEPRVWPHAGRAKDGTSGKCSCPLPVARWLLTKARFIDSTCLSAVGVRVRPASTPHGSQLPSMIVLLRIIPGRRAADGGRRRRRRW